MSFHAIPCWQVRCDWPGCAASPADWSDYAGWGDTSAAHDEALEGDWRTSRDEKLHYCGDHPVAWESDEEQVASMAGPYLLISDHGSVDDGTVTYVVAPTEAGR